MWLLPSVPIRSWPLTTEREVIMKLWCVPPLSWFIAPSATRPAHDVRAIFAGTLVENVQPPLPFDVVGAVATTLPVES